MKNRRYIIYGRKRDWLSAFVIGALCFAGYEYFDIDFYYLYIYFFIAGILSLFSSLVGWGAVSYDGLLIRFGIFNLRKLFLKWDDVKCMNLVRVEKKLFIRFGGGFALPTQEKIKIKAIKIKFSKILSDKLQKYMKKLEKSMIFGQRIEFCKEGNALIIYEEPPMGFEKLIEKIEGTRVIHKGTQYRHDGRP